MKAIELVKILCNYPVLTYELYGDMMVMDIDTNEKSRLDAYCMGFFGTNDENITPLPWDGKIEPGKTYFCLYVPYGRKAEIYNMMGECPDAFCKREDDIVSLWEIEK